MKCYQPRKIVLEQSIQSLPMVRGILENIPGIPVAVIDDPHQIVNEILQTPDPITEGKRILLLARQKGHFFKSCPGTQRHLCCGYKILNTANNCDLDCTYCILQGYFTNPLMLVYVNIDDLFRELHQLLTQHPRRFYRIGTGELTDSLTLEPLTGYGAHLIKFFARYDNAIIELKTKSVFIDSLLDLQHNQRTVISWSLNSESISRTEESLSPTIDERLHAARRCQAEGYRLGFHFDPMIYTDNWETGYRAVVEKLFSVIVPDRIAWISLGALRYPPYLDSIIRQRHPASKIVTGEFFPGIDGKLRYFKHIRIEMFKKMLEIIRTYSEEVFVYLCMESDEVWRRAFGWSPGNMATLSRLLDQRVMDV
ncbi:DNA photolyase [candidate division KSB1 bacterium]|nr:DNA photolyase [candidate division KSB1 bacterium]